MIKEGIWVANPQRRRIKYQKRIMRKAPVTKK